MTSPQGVIIPQANVRNLMLRPDVAEAIGAGQFHIYPIAHIDQGLERFTDVPAGNTETPDTVHGLVNARLRQLARDMVAFADTSPNGVQKDEAGTAVSA